MNFENLFEDLEAHFENFSSAKKSLINIQDINLVRVRTKNSVQCNLIAPILAVDFVAGLDIISPTWHFFPLHAVRHIEFEKESVSDLPKLRRLNINLMDFLLSTPVPSPAKWRLLGALEHQKSGQLAGLTESLIFLVDSNDRMLLAAPWQSIQQLSIESVDKLNGDF